MKVLLVLVPLLSFILLSEGDLITPSSWAVLVAGSKGWYNYRHQADICHAYHSLISKGFDKDKIIVMMYDDIANNPENKHKGVIMNKPNGTNVYEGVKIDYKGNDVNVPTFFNVLLGNKAALKGKGTERVLESGPKDNVFINFADHGAPGLIAFPNDELYAKDFLKTLKQMKTNGKYGKMVLYIEACEAGSMFDNLLDEYQSIFAVTASAPDESSWGWYCDDDNCYGDLYSINWMERLDKLNYSESLFEQYDAVRTKTLTNTQQSSHVNMYGDYRLGFLKFGSVSINNGMASSDEEEGEELQGNGVNSRDVPLYIAQKEFEKATDLRTRLVKKSNLNKLIQGRVYADNLVSEILKNVVKYDFSLLDDLEYKRFPLSEDIFDCYKSIISSFNERCYKITKHTYFLQHLYKFANLCANGYVGVEVSEVMDKVCNQRNVTFELIV